MKILATIRSTLFYVGYFPLIGIFSLLGCTVGLAMPHRQRQSFITLANALIVRWLNLSCGIRLEVEGLENIPDTPFVALSNHQSAWETYYLQRLLRPVSTILKKELLRIPLFGWGLAVTKPIAIDRSNPRAALREILDQGKLRLEEGNNVLIYPEGTRIEAGKTGNYGRSGAALAVAAKAPLLPIAHNAGNYWPARRFLKRPGTIRVVIGEPLSTENPDLDSKKLTADIKTWITSTVSNFPA